MKLAIHAIAHLITALVVLVVVLLLGLNTPSARVVELDGDRALRAFTEKSGALPDALFREQVLLFTDLVQATAQAYAKREGVIVVEAELALAGAKDVTEQIIGEALIHLYGADIALSGPVPAISVKSGAGQ